MRRRVSGMLLALVVLAGCVPAQADEPPRAAAIATPMATTAAAIPSQPPDVTASPALPHATGSPPPPAPTPAPTARPAEARAGKRVEVNLAEVADFVPQYTSYTCVGASLQMARAIITGDGSESRRAQRRLWEMARDRSLESPYGGANPRGWTAALNDLGLGPYRLVSRPSFDDAVRIAARALAETGKPVGLVMWAGRHAWVMTGFESRGHPRRDDARVTGVRVMDPLYPGRTRWGRSPAPNQLIELQTLARQFVMRDRPDYDFGVAPGWLLVLPTG